MLLVPFDDNVSGLLIHYCMNNGIVGRDFEFSDGAIQVIITSCVQLRVNGVRRSWAMLSPIWRMPPIRCSI